MPNWRKGVQGPQRKYVRKRRKPAARKAVDRRQDRSIGKLYKMVKYSKESKYVDQQLSTSIGTTWANLLPRDLTYIPEGTTDNTRVGNKIKIFRHQIKVLVTCGDLTNVYRLLVVRFKHCPTASLGIQNVLENYNNTTPFQILGFFKRNAPTGYNILYDSGVRTIAGNYQNDTSPASSSTQKQHNIILKNPKGWLVQYSDANANSCVNGFTYILAVTDSSVLPHVGFQSMSRTIFSG